MIACVLALVLAAAPESWQVEVDVFSARPNPTFAVTGADLARAKALLASAPVLAASTPVTTLAPNMLGYQGLRVRGGLDAELFRGRILRKGPRARALLEDGATRLERFLISVGVARGAISPQLEQLLSAPAGH